MKYSMLIFLFIFFSCGNKKDILLPKSNVTLVKDIQDHSPIYIFFKINGKDTVADVNRKNSIITTNWILNIDKRLPLRLVILEVMKLQQKKREEKAHKNEAALNYYSYADSIGKNMAFIPFTEVYYKMGKPKSGTIVFFNKNNEIWVNDLAVKRAYFNAFFKNVKINSDTIRFAFDANMSYGMYIQNKILMESLEKQSDSIEEFIY
ncbi:hypothetical protein [Flavobacterium lacustre]|uniref:hypothetical protein n=1 Tax=Flavobacterium lacustre TaxID=3016339 RepID=UPI0022B676FD|nr:hypothetical protein [Flavobacterium lacustre]